MRRKNMNTTKLLATSAVVMLMAATVPSMGQQEGVPHRERPAPAEKMAPQNAPRAHTQGLNGAAGEAPQNRGRAETTGQAPRQEQQSRPSEHKSEQAHGRTEPPRTEREHRTGLAPTEDRPGGESERDRKTDQVQNRVEQEGERSRTEGNRETTGQGAAATRSHNLTPETRTRIHEIVVRERNAPRVNSPNFDVSVGTRVPRTVPFVELPRTIVEIEPEWRGFEYFMIGDQLVIVNPRTMEIVAIVDA
jgi:hypothetical protein